jgi:hypothetical protein
LVGGFALAVSCAKGSNGALTSGSGGSGGTNDPTGPGSGGTGSPSNGSSTPTTPQGGGTPTTNDTSSGGAGVGGTAATTSASTGSSCNAPMHLCNGNCEGNTPDTGCYTSATCAACTPPTNGTSTCTATGQCDFTCNTGFMKSGNMCTCASQNCCTTANDCDPGDKCASGMCSCDNTKCFTYCVGFCNEPGTCISNACICAC